MSEPPVVPANAALLRATIRQTAPAIPQADNLGGSDDPRDLYYLLDYLCFSVDRAYPEIPCARGCSYCCETQVFRVSAIEWARVHQAFGQLPDAVQAAALERTRSVFGAYRDVLQAMADHWTRGERAPVELHNLAPATCPLLIDGRCSVYEGRPAICRGYGYFSATIDGNASLLICRQLGPEWLQQLEATGIEEIPMPNWNPVQRRIEELNGGQPIKPLPLWLLELSDQAAA